MASDNQNYEYIVILAEAEFHKQTKEIVDEINPSLQSNADKDFLRSKDNHSLTTVGTTNNFLDLTKISSHDNLEQPNNQHLLSIGSNDNFQPPGASYKLCSNSAAKNQESDYITVVEDDDFQYLVGDIRYTISCSIASTYYQAVE